MSNTTRTERQTRIQKNLRTENWMLQVKKRPGRDRSTQDKDTARLIYISTLYSTSMRQTYMHVKILAYGCYILADRAGLRALGSRLHGRYGLRCGMGLDQWATRRYHIAKVTQRLWKWDNPTRAPSIPCLLKEFWTPNSELTIIGPCNHCSLALTRHFFTSGTLLRLW